MERTTARIVRFSSIVVSSCLLGGPVQPRASGERVEPSRVEGMASEKP
jgi:hypothetical protein